MPDRLFRGDLQLMPELPDGRLVAVESVPERRELSWLYREGFIHPDVLDEWSELARHLRRSSHIILGPDGMPMWLEGPHVEGEPYRVTGTLEVRVARSERVVWGRAVTMKPVGPRAHLYIINSQLIRPEMVREFNELTAGLKMKTVR